MSGVRCNERIMECARLVAEEGPFQALGHATLRIRAGRMDAERILEVGGYELLVEEDDRLGMVVQLRLSRSEVERMAGELGERLGYPAPQSGDERDAWMDEFHRGLRQILRERHDIRYVQAGAIDLIFERSAPRPSPRDPL